MNARRQQTHTDQASALATGWLVSFLLHGTLAVAALLFLQRLQLAPQSKSFQWDVAMVGTMAPSTLSPSSQTTTSSAPPVQQAMPPQSLTRSRTAQPSLPNALTTRTAEPTYEESQVPPSQPQADQVSQPQDPIVSATDASAATSPAAPPSHILEDTSTQLAAPSELSASLEDSAASSQSHSTSTRTDYGWLTDLMAKWIEDLDKRYPATLRTEGAQGRVTLAAILHQDGLLSNVRVVKSSGNTTLDQVALEDVASGPPVKLSRPLDRSKMPIKFSIVYDLKTVR